MGKIDKKILVSFSGGLDSTTLLYWAKNNYREVSTISFNYGSRQNETEYIYAKKTLDKLAVNNVRIDLDFMSKYFKSSLLDKTQEIPTGEYNKENMASTVVPYRNGIMLSIIAGYAESNGFDVIALANHGGDHTIYADCRPEFIENIKKAIYYGTSNHIEVISPFCNMTKTDIVKLGSEIGVDFSLTYSCYNGREKHCGKCTTCTERRQSFIEAGIEDPTIYEEEE